MLGSARLKLNLLLYHMCSHMCSCLPWQWRPQEPLMKNSNPICFPERASKRRDLGNRVEASIIPAVRIQWPSQTLREQVASMSFSYPRWCPRHHSTIRNSSTAGMLLKTGPLLIKRFILREKQGKTQTFWVVRAALSVKNSERELCQFLFHAAWKFIWIRTPL